MNKPTFSDQKIIEIKLRPNQEPKPRGKTKQKWRKNFTSAWDYLAYFRFCIFLSEWVSESLTDPRYRAGPFWPARNSPKTKNQDQNRTETKLDKLKLVFAELLSPYPYTNSSFIDCQTRPRVYGWPRKKIVKFSPYDPQGYNIFKSHLIISQSVLDRKFSIS